jgi:chromosome segregation ATPase
MPQIEEVQFAWWGPFRPDSVPLAVDGINVATGPNGAGKTAFLDGIKLLLGTEQLKAKPADYIYVSGTDENGEPTSRAQRALLRAVFANPDRGNAQGRVFADAGRGCEAAPYVTAVCEVTRDRRRYTLLPGRIVWGGNGTAPEADFQRLSEIPAGHWYGPRQWQGLLSRAGITRSLLQLMSMAQGETDKAIHGAPEELLRRALELTGRQGILDEFHATKKKLAASRASHREASERHAGERQRLEVLAARVQRHREYLEMRARIEEIAKLELPVARHRSIRAQLESIARERKGTARSVEALRASVTRLGEDVPALEERLREHDDAAADLQERAETARRHLAETSAQQGALAAKRKELQEAIAAASSADAGAPDADAVATAQDAADEAAAVLRSLQSEMRTVEGEAAELASGRPMPPPGLDEFREQLAAHGIDAWLVAERLDADEPELAEAVLDNGVWTLVVSAARFEDAVGLAVERRHRLPIARASEGTPDGALSGTRGMPEAGAYLAEASLPLGEVPGIDARGLARGRTWAAWRRPEQPVLGEKARRAALAAAEARLTELRREAPVLDEAAAAARSYAQVLRDGLRAAENLSGVESEWSAAQAREKKAGEAMAALGSELTSHGETRGRLDNELAGLRERAEKDTEQLMQSERRLQTYDRQLGELEGRLTPLNAEQEAIDEVGSEDALERELARLRSHLDDEARYPVEIRSEMIVVEHSDQERRVEENADLLEGRERDLEEVGEEVERARQQYLEHLRQVIAIVGRRFRELCERAGMEGSLQLVPSGDLEDEMGLEMKVAHVRGERLLSSRHPHHSGGQRVKMAILLLLASMGVEGATDLLIMDEHSAHLDSRNIDHVAELMGSLKGQVQFILAMPSHAEAQRLSWCDHQLAFYLRSADELYAPPIRLLTRLPDDGGVKYVERMGQLPVAD